MPETDKIAFIFNDTYIYWNTIILTLATATSICFFLGFYLGSGGPPAAAAAAVPLSLMLAAPLARLLYWYCRPESYPHLTAALTASAGGYALAGVFAGCILTALLLRLLRVSPSLGQMLDAMALAGAAGIALGRLSSLFDSSCRGMLMPGGNMPWVCAAVNAASGETEYRLATFLLQAMVSGGLFLILTIWYPAAKKGRDYRPGDASLIFLLCYCAGQVLLDSTRCDSLFLPGNGFIRPVQILSVGAMVFCGTVFSLRLPGRPERILLWLVFAACLGGAGYMEYYVQRHGSEAAFAYSLMAACLTGAVVTALVTRLLALRSACKLQKPFYITEQEA